MITINIIFNFTFYNDGKSGKSGPTPYLIGAGDTAGACAGTNGGGAGGALAPPRQDQTLVWLWSTVSFGWEGGLLNDD